ncbi:hypothetical protein M0811_13758 [Anaeramoeba ignava]|uniref:CBM20 domain-containing protein n=1 Tax=Anaeramoeba ignava TaxID=1746090 RepID=A0A9Q0M0Q3_ANAIG|nr:hypothetical protein M0811_13758 [Anaeramoeba ignava]
MEFSEITFYYSIPYYRTEHTVYITGNILELGYWDTKKAFKLETNEELFPIYTTKIFLPKFVQIEYKYITKDKYLNVTWESFGAYNNRKLYLDNQPKDVCIDGFSTTSSISPSSLKFFAQRGYSLTTETAFRILYSANNTFVDREKLMEEFIHLGGDILGQDEQNTLLIILFRHCDSANLVSILLEKGSDPNHSNLETPLYYALCSQESNSKLNQLRLLLLYGADVNKPFRKDLNVSSFEFLMSQSNFKRRFFTMLLDFGPNFDLLAKILKTENFKKQEVKVLVERYITIQIEMEHFFQERLGANLQFFDKEKT